MAMKTRYTVVDGEVIAEKRSGVRKQYVPDPLGSTVALLDNTQAQTDTFAYWPYGEEASRTGTTPASFRFVGTLGYYRDRASRTYVRARTLDTQQGRWLTEDPIGFWGGETNLYNYVMNSPIIDIDPSGLICCQIACNIEGGNDSRCTGQIFGWGCGNNANEAFSDAENGDPDYSANERVKIWNQIHDLHCQKRHCHVVKCQNNRFKKNRFKKIRIPQPVAPAIEAFANCSDAGLVGISIAVSAIIVLTGGKAIGAIGGGGASSSSAGGVASGITRQIISGGSQVGRAAFQ